MKYLTTLLLATACYAEVNPKYMAGQEIEYKIPHFYRLVCTGKGVIENYWVSYWDKVVYSVRESSKDLRCPGYMEVLEKDIITKESSKCENSHSCVYQSF